MATAKKLPSGNWRVMVYIGRDYNGKRIYKSATGATKREAEYAAAEILNQQVRYDASNVTVEQALRAYVNSRRRVISPTTEREYERQIENCYTEILPRKIVALTNLELQSWIDTNAYKSKKTLLNEFGLLTAALKKYKISFTADEFTFPQKKKFKPYVPNDSEIQKILENSDGDYRIAVLLAAFGPMRRSEICALRPSDIRGESIQVERALVKNKDKEWVLKDPKTYAGQRVIQFPEFVIKEFRQHGKIQMTPDAITHKHAKMLKSIGIPHFRFHDYRHYAASILHALGMHDKYIIERGGWSSDDIVKRIYEHAIDDVSRHENAAANKHFEEKFAR